MQKIKLISAMAIFVCSLMYSQKISDGQTIDLDGYSITFNVNNKENITAGGKNLDRYKVSARLVNNTGKSLNLRLNSAPQIVLDDVVVELDCINATGAKLTSKKLKLKLKPQNLNVSYWSYDKNGKYVQSVLPVVAGYYLDPGDSVSDNGIFMVPQGEILNVVARKLK